MTMLGKKARIGFIGAGWWATSNHMPVLAGRDDVEFTGVCRLGREALRQVKERFGFAYGSEDYRELLDQCELDAVVVASPHTLHYEHAKAALLKGLHVMCEKPFTVQANQARELVDLARQRGLHLLVPYGWHYKPFIQQAKALMADGAVGDLEYVLCQMASPIRRLLSGHGRDVPKASGQAGDNLFETDAATWADPAIAGGGYGHAQISHSSGLMFWLTGLRAATVFSMMTSPGARVDLYDAITARFTNGAIGTLSGSGTVPPDQAYQVDLRIFGTEGMLLLDCERARMHLRRNDGRHVTAEVDPRGGGYECQGPPQNFVDLILGKTDVNFAPGEVALRSVELLDAAYRSAASGHPEEVA
ncbi:MAG TPA: Gfo/Idh/MocA family oxidoreductase [Pirellulales bacterium]|nr:Gfo/Idh/MocA family oxidoreductase [Pirellulales bacterium]